MSLSEKLSNDILEFLAILHDHKVEYVMVGGNAVIFYGHSRLTGDIDIFFNPSEENIVKLWSALLDFWQGDVPGIENMNELMDATVVIQFGSPPNRIDLMNSLSGVDFPGVWKNKVSQTVQISKNKFISVNIIGIGELILNKQNVARSKDLDDLSFLLKKRNDL